MSATPTFDAQRVLDVIVAGRGGIDAFDDGQVQVARAIVALMLEMDIVEPGKRGAIGRDMAQLFAQLPPRMPPKPRGEISTLGLSLRGLANLYSRLVGGTDGDEPGEMSLFGRPDEPIPDSTPAEPARAPAPSSENASVPFPRPTEPFSATPTATPIEQPPPAAGTPPDERLRIVTFWSIGAQPVPPPPEPASEPIEPAPTPDPRLAAFGRTVYSGAG